jgi:acetyl-CoA carboxylase biotin carboxylase subunit
VRTFKKILIANRGEIAVRLIRTCRKLGIKTLVVYSTADQHLLPVKLADEAVCIGSFRSRESYLSMEAILQTAVQYECQALHPGYGFLSENALFSQLFRQYAITFIGPRPEHIQRMGNKTAAKQAIQAAGLLLIPGSDGVLNSIAEGERLAQDIGFPVLLKAKAGGGGRGMRIVNQLEKFRQAFEEASLEAQSAFGDGSLYLEKWVSPARHIEVQVAFDAYGKGTHFGVRECSIQRKHQKLIEEAPAPGLTEAAIQELGDRVVNALQKIGYLNVGTVEFLLAPEGTFYFIEMNTRLQVEHPVTENICHPLDLVELQIQLAGNTPLPAEKTQMPRSGHSLECRINAEDPDQDFKPSPGRIQRLCLPQGEGIRVDTFLEEGIEIPPYYDSLIAKLIVSGSTRNEALEKMRKALGDFKIEGIATTIPFHQKVLSHPTFKEGKYHTHFLETMLSTS